MAVKIYTIANCSYCKLARNFLQQHGIPYEESDVHNDPRAWREMEVKSHQLGVPVIEIDNEVYVGFDRKALREAFGLA